MFGDRLREIRTQKGFTQDQMAELLNVKRQSYSAYERNISTPDVTSIVKIANFLNVTTDFLVGNDEKTTEKKEKEIFSLVEELTDEEKAKVLEYANLLKNNKNNN